MRSINDTMFGKLELLQKDKHVEKWQIVCFQIARCVAGSFFFAVCCSVLQCVVGCVMVLHGVAGCCRAFWCIVVCYSVLHTWRNGRS